MRSANGMRRWVAHVLLGLLTVCAGIAATPAAAGPRPVPGADVLRVGTWNVNSTGTCSGCPDDPHSWSARRGPLMQSIWAAAPDVLAVQEAALSRTQGVRHVDDVRDLLAPLGYLIASDYYVNHPASGASLGAHIFLRTSRIALAGPPTGGPAAGYELMSRIAGPEFGAARDRSIAWAFLVGRTRTTPTLLLSVHLPTQKTAVAEQGRVAVARALRPWAARLASDSGFPQANIVVAGDFNSFDRRQPQGAQAVLLASGLQDGFTAPERVNGQYGTTNYTPATVGYRGYPPSPPHYSGIPTRIDYIMSTVAPLRYEVFLVLDSEGRFDARYRASDHNLVLVDLPLRRVPATSSNQRMARPRS